MSELKNVSETENTHDGFDEPNIQKVLLRSVLTSQQVSEVQARKKQPTTVLTELRGSPAGYRGLDDRVDPSTKAMLDEQGNMHLVAPVTGG